MAPGEAIRAVKGGVVFPLQGGEGGGRAEYPRPLLFLSREMFVYPKAREIEEEEEEEEESLLVESSTDVS